MTVRLVALFAVLAIGAGSWMLTCAAWRFDRVAAGVRPLEPRRFERLTLLTVGTGGSLEDHNRRGPATAVAQGERMLLVDAGRGVAEALRAAEIPVSQPEAVLLTNLLPENTLGLDDLLVTGWLRGRREPLALWGPPGTRALARASEAAAAPGARALADALALPELAGFAVREVADGEGGEIGELAILAGALDGGPLPALAWRFEWRGRAAVVSATGWAPDGLAAFARGARLLVHDGAMLPTQEQAAAAGLEWEPESLRREAALHTSLTQAAGIARRAGIETLVLVRLRPPPVYDLQVTSLMSDGFGGRIAVAEDGDEFTP